MFTILFLLLAVYMVWFLVAKSDSVINSSYNKRQELYAKNVIRGDILSADGKVLATSDEDGDSDTREYPYDDLYAHAVGFTTNGKAGVESQYNFYLLRSHAFVLKRIYHNLAGEKDQGDSVVTTLDSNLQETAYDALGGDDGAVIAIEPDTGKILAMVSKPDFDPNTVAYDWDDIVNDEDSSVLLNRATQGLYPPGSTFKIITALEYMRENSNYNAFRYDCEGEVTRDDYTIHCYKGAVHGEEDLTESFAHSCNTAFSTIGLSLNIGKLNSFCNSMLFNQALPTGLKTAKSQFTLSDSEGEGKIMTTSIGQGDTLVSPIHMAMIASAICNDGVLCKPYIADHIENEAGTVVRRFDKQEYGKLLSKEDTQRIRSLMEAVTDYGTGSALSGRGYDVAGKTGSAEYNEDKDSHGWFVGYAQDGEKEIAIAVIVEDGGSGSSSAVPVAGEVFDAYFDE